MNARIGTLSLSRVQWLLAAVLSVSLVALSLVLIPQARGAQSTKRAASAVRASTIHRASVLAPSTTACSFDAGTSTRTCDLYAHKSSGSISWPGVATSVPFWSYTTNETDAVGTTGPTLVVNVGETVHLNLYNRLGDGQQTALSIPQFEGLDADVLGVADGSGKQYSLTASRPGTFIYQAGGVAEGSRQAAMGMVGALIVLPSAAADAGTAYGAGTGTDYTDDSVVLLTDVDPAFNNDPVGFDLRGYSPKLHLLNGAPYPATTHISAAPGGVELLRIINGGIIQHSLGVLGTNQKIVGESSRELKHPYGVAVEKISAGDTLDMRVEVPTTGGPLFPVYDSSTRLDNSTGPATGPAPFGGALTFIDSGTVPSSNAGPTVTSLALGADKVNGSVDLGFTAIAGSLTQPDVAGTQYALDNGAATSGTDVTIAAGPGPVPVTGSVLSGVLSALPDGSHTLLVRASTVDPVTTNTVWGPWAAIGFTVDTTGPTTALVLDPAVTKVSPTVLPEDAPLVISGTSTDAATGGSAVTDAHFYVRDASNAVVANGPLTVSPAGHVTVAADGEISVATLRSLDPGTYSVTATGLDALGNTGAASPPVTFVVDRAGPTIGDITITPSPNNGTSGVAYDPTSVEVRATYSDGTGSGVADGEAFLGGNSTGNGSEFPMFLYPKTGTGQVLLGTFPVSALTQFPGVGPITVPIWVHARDAAGNWGALKRQDLVINRDVIFANAFEQVSGLLVPPWAKFVQNNAGDLTGALGTAGAGHAFIVSSTNGGGNTFDNTKARAYLVDTSPASESTYKAAFSFTPNSFRTGSVNNTNADARIFTIFAARTVGSNANVLTVQYRMGGTRQVRVQVLTAGGLQSGNWINIAPGAQTLHLSWQSGASTSATLLLGNAPYNNFNRSRVQNANTLAYHIDTVMLGVSRVDNPANANVTPGNISVGSMSFDNFDSRRITAP